MVEVCYPHLVNQGVKRLTLEPDADIKTINIWYPDVIKNYVSFCLEAGLQPYGGGTIDNQKWNPGRITSGYRDDALEGRKFSPHGFALALDIFIGDLSKQVKIIKFLEKYFNRFGLYEKERVIHGDLVNNSWIQEHSGFNAMRWLKINGKYIYFSNTKELLENERIKTLI